MISPLDIKRLAVRIETLQRQRTSGWQGGDELELRNSLPGGRARNALPDPAELRDMADRGDPEDLKTAARQWRTWISTAQRLEGLVRDNDPRNPKRMMRDMMRGKMPRRATDRKFQNWLKEIDDHMQDHGMGYEDAVRSGDPDEAIEKVWEDLYKRGARPMDAIEKVFGEEYRTASLAQASQEHKPGDVWKGKTKWRAISRGGGAERSFDVKDEADLYAKSKTMNCPVKKILQQEDEDIAKEMWDRCGTRKEAAAVGPYEDSEIDGLRVTQVQTDNTRSKASIRGNKLLIKWGMDAPVGSPVRQKYLPKWVRWAKKKLGQKKERVEQKKEWTRTVVDGYSVYDLEDKEQVAAILAKIQRDIQPVLREFGLKFTSLKESVAEGSLGFNRGKRIIALSVRQKRNMMKLRKYSAIMATMIHELAHLRHMNHGPQFKAFEIELREWARGKGIYSPGGRGASKEAASGSVSVYLRRTPSALDVLRKHTDGARATGSMGSADQVFLFDELDPRKEKALLRDLKKLDAVTKATLLVHDEYEFKGYRELSASRVASRAFYAADMRGVLSPLFDSVVPYVKNYGGFLKEMVDGAMEWDVTFGKILEPKWLGGAALDFKYESGELIGGYGYKGNRGYDPPEYAEYEIPSEMRCKFSFTLPLATWPKEMLAKYRKHVSDAKGFVRALSDLTNNSAAMKMYGKLLADGLKYSIRQDPGALIPDFFLAELSEAVKEEANVPTGDAWPQKAKVEKVFAKVKGKGIEVTVQATVEVEAEIDDNYDDYDGPDPDDYRDDAWERAQDKYEDDMFNDSRYAASISRVVRRAIDMTELPDTPGMPTGGPRVTPSRDEIENAVDNASRGLDAVDPTVAEYIVQAGHWDGDHSDDAVGAGKKSWAAAALKPSQSTMRLPMAIGLALSMLDKGKVGGYLGAIVSADGHILDGHHRWAATILASGRSGKVGGYQAGLKGKKLLGVLNIISKGMFGVRNGNPGSGNIADFKPGNVRDMLEKFAADGIGGKFPIAADKVRKILTDNFGSVEAGIDTMSKNVKLMTLKVPGWAPARKQMPVIEPEEVPEAAKALNEGIVDHESPHAVDEALWMPPQPEEEPARRPMAARVADRYEAEAPERRAAMEIEAGIGDWLKWMAQPFKVIWKHHKEFVSGPIDDAMDNIIRDLAPLFVKKLGEAEVDADVDEFLAGAQAGKWIADRDGFKATGEGQYRDETEDFLEGYDWGFDNAADWGGKKLPSGVMSTVVKDAITEFRGRVTEQVIAKVLKNAWSVVSPAHTLKAIMAAVKKHGWKLGVGFALFEIFEHALLPSLMIWATGDPSWAVLGTLPIGEVIYAIIIRILGRAPKELADGDPDGHLDWYEAQYGEVRLASEPDFPPYGAWLSAYKARTA
jgi:hypothetical protein